MSTSADMDLADHFRKIKSKLLFDMEMSLEQEESKTREDVKKREEVKKIADRIINLLRDISDKDELL